MKAKGVIGVFIAWVFIFTAFVILTRIGNEHPVPIMENLELMMRQALIVGLGAIGMSYVIMTGGIDLHTPEHFQQRHIRQRRLQGPAGKDVDAVT